MLNSSTPAVGFDRAPQGSGGLGGTESSVAFSRDQEELLALLLREQADPAERSGNEVRVQAEDSSVLIPIKPSGHLPPIFCVGVFHFNAFAKSLPAALPVWGLLGDDLDENGAYMQRIPELATMYVREIRRAYPSGPYHIFGFCFGGLVAYEMACQLERVGAPVGIVTLLESYPANGEELAGTTDGLSGPMRQSRIAKHALRARNEGTKYVKEWTRHRIAFEKRRFRIAWTGALAKAYGMTGRRTPNWLRGAAMREPEIASGLVYKPGTFEGDLRLIVCSCRDERPDSRQEVLLELGDQWKAYAIGKVDVITYDTRGHDDLLKPPLVKDLSDRIAGFFTDGAESGMNPITA